MDREELEESSSSQNVSITVRAVQRGARGKEICFFSDGSSFLMPSGFARNHGVAPGLTLSDRDVHVLKYKALKVSAMRKALEYLGWREHTALQLKMKLVRKGFSEAVVQDVITSLREDGSLDEERFCRSWISSRLRKHPEGAIKLKAGLMRAGIPGAMAEKQLLELYPEEEQLRMLQRAAEKMSRSTALPKEKFVKKLCSLGFSCKQVLYYIENIH